ncbi:MAG: ECF transporter S component [Ruminococcus sp.]|nr:ECF transporter S component [Ruminococcus sp.]
MTNAVAKQKLSVKAQTIGAIIAIISAVAVPQILHVIGAASGLGTALGEIFLPMHLPIILAGLLAGPYAAGIAGLLGPLVSHLLTGMPGSVMLPFMMIELAVYGISAGMLRNVKIPNIAKVLIAQILGRAVRGGAILIAFYAFGSAIKPAVILSSISAGLIGIVLQLIIIPLAVYRLRSADNE